MVGTGGLLLVAKENGLLLKVGPALEKLADAGYRLSPRLREEIARLAGE